MRNKLYSLVALCAVVLVSACGDHETPVFTDNFIAFKGSSRTITESGSAIDILITSSAPGATSGISLAGTATEGVDFTISSTTVSSGSDYTTTVTITPIDNLVSDGTRTAELTLTDGGFTGGADGKVYTVTINDDDCPFDAAAFVGDFNATDPGNPFGGFPTEYVVEVSEEGTTANRFVVSDYLGLTAGGFGPRTFFMDLNPDLTNPSVTIPVQPLQARITSSGFRIGIASTEAGAYVSCTGSVTVNVQVLALVDDGGTTVAGAFTAPYTFSLER